MGTLFEQRVSKCQAELQLHLRTLVDAGYSLPVITATLWEEALTGAIGLCEDDGFDAAFLQRMLDRATERLERAPARGTAARGKRKEVDR